MSDKNENILIIIALTLFTIFMVVLVIAGDKQCIKKETIGHGPYKAERCLQYAVENKDAH